MSNELYQQFFDSQKKMFGEWQSGMREAFKKFNELSQPGADPKAYFDKLQETSQDFLKKVSEGSKVYQSLFDLWQRLGEKGAALESTAAAEIYDTWIRQFTPLVREIFIPGLPESVRTLAGNVFDRFEGTSHTLSDYFKTYAASEESLRQAFYQALAKGPKGYADFLEAWKKGYDETLGKALNAPAFGKDMDFWERQKAAFDKFVKYHIAATKFYTALVEIAQDATKKMLEDFMNMSARGEQPKTFDEFYKYWARIVSAAYDKVLFSEEISGLAGNMIDELSRFKEESDKLFEHYLASLPIPKKSDMDDLYKTIYELKKEVRELKKTIKDSKKGQEK
jgi:polyhydroxyalkanoate synthesis regulator phasin